MPAETMFPLSELDRMLPLSDTALHTAAGSKRGRRSSRPSVSSRGTRRILKEPETRRLKNRGHLAIAVGTPITGRPPHRTVRAAFLHTAPTSDVSRLASAFRTRSGVGDTLSRHCVRHVRHRFAFSLASALRSTASAAGRPALFGGLVAVEWGELGLIPLPPPARSNGSCSCPAGRFPMWVALVGEGWVVFQGRGGSAARGRSLR